MLPVGNTVAEPKRNLLIWNNFRTPQQYHSADEGPAKAIPHSVKSQGFNFNTIHYCYDIVVTILLLLDYCHDYRMGLCEGSRQFSMCPSICVHRMASATVCGFRAWAFGAWGKRTVVSIATSGESWFPEASQG